MRPRPVIPRVQAVQDIQDAVDIYFKAGADKAAMDFVNALEHAFAHIGRYPSSGSHRHARELDLPGLRSWPVGRFPHLIFYLEREDHLDVWRILHGKRDLAAGLALPPGTEIIIV